MVGISFRKKEATLCQVIQWFHSEWKGDLRAFQSLTQKRRKEERVRERGSGERRKRRMCDFGGIGALIVWRARAKWVRGRN